MPDYPIDGPHTKPVSTINGGCSALGFSDKISIEMRLRQVQSFHAPLGDYAAVIGLPELSDGALARQKRKTYAHDETSILFQGDLIVRGISCESHWRCHVDPGATQQNIGKKGWRPKGLRR